MIFTLISTGCFRSGQQKKTNHNITSDSGQWQSNQRKQTSTKIPHQKKIESNVSLPQPFMPKHLIIPTINVSANIKPVGVLENGQMDILKATDVVGILHPGILAGAKGNLVLDGHVDSYTGPAVFFNLKKLKPGDVIIIRDNKDHQLTYRVESVETFITSQAPIHRIFGETDDIRLNLITCTGRYSRKKKEHEQRLIVFAKLDGEK
ncbi:class F sortase [Paenibacillus sp. IHBB 10380]|uniref:class F sortase n=1 Tax=Paenibacillus sp. IHBB 10380 TaxID=1566358 RepID=UPI001364CA7B|nr:class F sortase [Paenibacillus sp. IHBB 10380]